MKTTNHRLFVSVFGNEHDLLTATQACQAKGLKIHDVYAPYPVHGLDRAMGLRPSRLTWVCLAFGALGLGFGLWLQFWTSALDWPINVGGKPLKSLPAFVPVIFELMVLFAGVGTVLTLFLRTGLRPGKQPDLLAKDITNHRFVLVLKEPERLFEVDVTRSLCEQHNAIECHDGVMLQEDTKVKELTG